MIHIKHRLTLSIVLGGILAATPLLAAALPYGSGSYGNCTYDTCGITLADSGGVNLTATPTPAGAVSIAGQTVTVTTSASTGFTLQLESSAAQTTLLGSTQSIAPSSGSFASPQSLAVNTWGYRMDGLGGFGAGPTSTVINATSTPLTFAGLSSSGTPTTLVTTNAASPSPGTDYTVWYGVRVNTTLTSDIYSRTVIYTATTN